MQTSRRKRERAEKDRQDTAATSSRVRSRGGEAPPPKRLNISHADKNEVVAAAELSLSNDDMSGSTPLLAQAQPSPDASQAATTIVDGADSGDDHSEEGLNRLNAMNVSSSLEEAVNVATDGNTGHSMTRGGNNKFSLGVDDGGNTREERISALISHRTLLLARMRQCKVATERRIKDNHEKRKRPGPLSETKAGEEKLTNDATKTGGAVSGTADGPAMSDNDEIESYQEKCRLAVQASRKQKAELAEASGEKRVSVSLRRGSSVGKRMNAALSSLVSGGGGSSSLPHSVASASMHQMPVASGVSAESIPAVSAEAIQIIHTPVPNSKQAAFNAQIQPVISSSGAQVATVPKQGGPGQKKRSSSVGQKMLKTYRGAGQASTAPPQSSSNLPLHVTAGTRGLPFNRLACPAVHFPEAQALRERRDAIRERLSKVIRKRIATVEERKDSRKFASSNVPNESRLRTLSTPLKFGVHSPSKLPRRRKTQWDYLLEEMRWLATDFVEERKWKAASARSLGSVVVSNRLHAVVKSVSVTERDKKASTDVSNPDEETNFEEQDEKASIDSGVASDMNADLPDEMDERTYEKPSAPDLKLVQSTGKIISDMVAEVWEGILDCRPFSNTDEPLVTALSRHNKLRKTFERCGEGSDSQATVTNGPASQGVGRERRTLETDKKDSISASFSPQATEAENGTSVVPSEDKRDSDEDKVRQSSLSNEEISERIESSTRRIKDRKVRRNRTKTLNECQTLGPAQRKAVDFIEFVWSGDDSAGSVLDSPVACGKTVLSCSLLCRHHSEGSQLLACTPTRLFQWAYELEQFSDLRVHIFGMRCGISSAIPQAKGITQFQPGDVVLCEFSSLSEAKLDLSAFRTIVIDARFPTESLFDTTQAGDSNLLRKHGSPCTAGSPERRLIPSELISHQWWAAILVSLRQSSARRLLIDNNETRFLREEDGLGYTGLTERERLDTLAAMSAFVVGPDLFYSEDTRSPQHRVVSWAKHCAKDGRQRKGPQFEEIRGVLTDAALPFRYTMNPEDGNEVAGRRSDDEDWEVRRCPLSASQRSAYEKCCTGVRGALSFVSVADHPDIQDGPAPFQLAIQALLRLRRVCVHSRLDDVVNKATLSATSLFGISSSVSQPHMEMAADILSDSGKLRQLVTILRDECGFDTQIDAFELQSDARGRKVGSRKKAPTSKKPRKKKVAILAILPEAQILTSLLLSSIGILHELLALPRLLSNEELFGNPAALEFPLDENVEKVMNSTMAWIDSQLSLLKFSLRPRTLVEVDEKNSSANILSKRFSSCEVVITSPVIVGAGNGGLGIEAADVVICLDEDWSGRDALLFERIRKKCSLAHKMKVAESDNYRHDHCRFIRLVCEKTCEQVFLSGFDHEENELYGRDWPSNGQGYLALPRSLSSWDIPLVDEKHKAAENDVEGAFRFPALNVLRYRGTILSSVFATSLDVPTDFVTGDLVRFLPFQDWEEDTVGGKNNVSVELVRSLIAHEVRSSQPGRVHGYAEQKQLVSSSSGSVPPFPSNFPSAVMTRHDVMAMASRIFIGRLGKRLAHLEGSVSPAFTTASHLARPGVNGIVADEASSAMTADHGNLADAWHKSGLSCRPGDMVFSLLSYRPAQLNSLTNHDLSSERDNGKLTRDDSGISATDGVVESRVQDVHATGQRSLDGQPGSYSTPNDTEIQRSNAFSASYSTSPEVISSIVKDGNQGCEPLAYFPPLFPNLLGASEQALDDLFHLHTSKVHPRVHAAHSNIVIASKRKEPFGGTYSMTEDPKRPRLKDSLLAIEGPKPLLPPQGLGSGLSGKSLDVVPSGISLTEHVRGVGHISRRNERDHHLTEPSIVTEDEASQWDHASFLFEMGEDYGLLGIGALSSQSDATRDASMLSVCALAYANWKDPYGTDGLEQELYPSTISCDAEEVETHAWGKTDDTFLESILLFVTKGARMTTPSGYMGIPAKSAAAMSFSSPSTAWANSKVPSLLPSAAVAGGHVNGAIIGGMKKSKKKSQSAITIGAFSRMNHTDYAGRSVNPYLGSSALQSANGKETYRSKILSSILARQRGDRSSLFQVPSFLLASIRIRDDVLRRVVSSSAGSLPGFQRTFSVRRSWTSGCYRLSASTKTGDAACLMSEGQLTTMQTMPSPVDFGPFVAGYIPSPYAVSSTTTTGIALPIGVKILYRTGKQPMQAWKEPEDAKLQETVLRFGLNWHLVARSINGCGVNEITSNSEEHSSTARKDCVVRSPLRSPGQCQERWQYLVRHKLGLAEELSRVERLRRKNAVTRPTSAVDGHNVARRLVALPRSFGKADAAAPLSLVLPCCLLSENVDIDEVMTEINTKLDVTKARAKRSFAALRMAAKKKYEVHMPIPGSVNGEKPSVVASHPSHSQSVQAAVAVNSRGLAEMWPLQILDLADKQRAARPPVGTSSSANSRQSSGASVPPAAQSHRPLGYQSSPVCQPKLPANYPHNTAAPLPRSPQKVAATSSSQQGFPLPASASPAVSSNSGPATGKTNEDLKARK